MNNMRRITYFSMFTMDLVNYNNPNNATAYKLTSWPTQPREAWSYNIVNKFVCHKKGYLEF